MAHKARRRPSWKKRKSKLKIELAKALRDEIQKEINSDFVYMVEGIKRCLRSEEGSIPFEIAKILKIRN
jgi:hypothetical protein